MLDRHPLAIYAPDGNDRQLRLGDSDDLVDEAIDQHVQYGLLRPGAAVVHGSRILRFVPR